MNWRPFTSAGFSPDMTIGELETELGRLVKGRTSVLPLEVFRELTGLRDMSDWGELIVCDLLESVGMEEDGDCLFSPIRGRAH